MFDFSIHIENMISIFSVNLFNHVDTMQFFKRFDLLNTKKSNERTKIFILYKKKVGKIRSIN